MSAVPGQDRGRSVLSGWGDHVLPAALLETKRTQIEATCVRGRLDECHLVFLFDDSVFLSMLAGTTKDDGKE